jgi:hypothetical protein
MKAPVNFWIVLLIMTSALPVFVPPASGQGPTCYVSPSMERTYIFIRELDSDGNPVGQRGGGRWVGFGEQAPVTSSTGNISINYRPESSDREIKMDPASCTGGNVISVP